MNQYRSCERSSPISSSMRPVTSAIWRSVSRFMAIRFRADSCMTSNRPRAIPSAIPSFQPCFTASCRSFFIKFSRFSESIPVSSIKLFRGFKFTSALMAAEITLGPVHNDAANLLVIRILLRSSNNSIYCLLQGYPAGFNLRNTKNESLWSCLSRLAHHHCDRLRRSDNSADLRLMSPQHQASSHVHFDLQTEPLTAHIKFFSGITNHRPYYSYTLRISIRSKPNEWIPVGLLSSVKHQLAEFLTRFILAR